MICGWPAGTQRCRAAARKVASFRRADAAQVCNDVGFVILGGQLESSLVLPAWQIVNERWRDEWKAEAPPLPRSDVSFRLDQKTANLRVATVSSLNQWSVTTEGKQKKSTCANRVSLQKNNNNHSVRRGRYRSVLASILALHCSKKRQISRWPWPAE